MHDAIDWNELTRGQSVIVRGDGREYLAVVVEVRQHDDPALTHALVANAEGICSRAFTSNLTVQA